MDAGTIPYGYGGPTSPSRPSTRLDLGAILRDGWVLFAKDWVALAVALLIAGVLGMLTLGILLPVLYGGVYKMILRRIREGRPAEIGDVFSCFDRFGPLFVFFLLMMVIVVLLFGIAFAPLLLTGGLLSGDSNGLEAVGVGAIMLTVLLFLAVYVVIFYLSIIWMYVTQLIIDRDAGIGEALGQSRRLVMANGFWWHVLAMLLVGAITSVVTTPISILSQFTFGLASVLVIVVVPFQLGCYMSMYFQVTGDRHLLPSAYPGVPATAYEGGGRVTAPPTWGAPGPAVYGAPPAPGYGAAPPWAGQTPPPAPTAVGDWGPPSAPPPVSEAPPTSPPASDPAAPPFASDPAAPSPPSPPTP